MRSGKSKSTKKFRVFLIIDISSSYGREMLKGISLYAQKYKNWEFDITFTSFFGKNFYVELEPVKEKIDGIIAYTPEKKLLSKVLRSGIPAIVKGIDKSIPGYINFSTDNFMLCKRAFDYFRVIGLEKFAYCGLDVLHWSRERLEALRQITLANGFELVVYPKPRTKTLRLWENEKPVLAKWLSSLPKPIGLLAANDFRAKEVLEVCAEAQIAVPEEIAVLGVDNDECICPFTSPPLSSIDRFHQKAGYEAALALNRLMSGKKVEADVILIEPKGVVQRQSTNILAVENPTIAEALRYIRSHITEPIAVEDVTRQIAVHPRWLYELFKQNLGYTVHDEIKRVRTDEIARMLLDTNLTVSQIAHQMGFRNVDHVARYFHSVKRLTPIAFRNQYKHFQK
jgi:LacI family transcriptional regulator